jgi:hypothetical protein
MSADTMTQGDALDLLEQEDLALRDLFARMRRAHSESVTDRADYGDLVKTMIQHLATREAAITEVVGAVAKPTPRSDGH